MDEFEDLDDDYEIIVMTDDDGNDIEFILLDSLVYKKETYLFLIMAKEADNDESDAYIFKQISEDNEEVLFEDPTEEEFEAVSILFRENSQDYEVQ